MNLKLKEILKHEIKQGESKNYPSPVIQKKSNKSIEIL